MDYYSKSTLTGQTMTEAFVETETHRTKCKWVARALQDFGKPRTTIRALFYHALRRRESDYPICGGFVGEIRVTRPYHENDGERLPKWANKAKELGYVPKDAFLEEVPGEHAFLPDAASQTRPYQIELWLNRSAFNPLLLPICAKQGAVLVSISGRPLAGPVEALLRRSQGSTTIILCLSDLSIHGFTFCRDLAQAAATGNVQDERDIRLKRIALTPGQVLEQKIPMVPGEKGTKKHHDLNKRYLRPYGLDPRRMAELDALEAYYPRGIAGFVEHALSRYSTDLDLDKEEWLLDLRNGILPGEEKY
jgi:hypothetical protein